MASPNVATSDINNLKNTIFSAVNPIMPRVYKMVIHTFKILQQILNLCLSYCYKIKSYTIKMFMITEVLEKSKTTIFGNSFKGIQEFL